MSIMLSRWQRNTTKKKAYDRYQSLSKEKKKKKKQQYGRERYKNLSKDRKQKVYRKKYYKMRKNALM